MSQKFLSSVALTGISSGSILKVNSSGEIVAAVSGTDYITSATASQWTTTGNDIYYTTGNVGIGTGTPSKSLHIQSSANDTLLYLQSTSTAANGYSQIQMQAGSRSAYFWVANQNATAWGGDGSLNIYTTNGAITWWTANTQKMILNTDGNLGVGTTSPSTKLHVIAGGLSTGQSNSVAFFRSSTNIYFDIYNAVNATVNGGTGLTGTSLRGSDAIALAPYGSELMRLDSGKVGIGETSPDGLLHIKGSAQATEFYIESATGTASTSGAIKIAQNNRNTVDLGGEMVFYVQSNNIEGTFWREAMAILSTGNIGIGNSSPGSKRLKVTGAAEITGDFTLSGLGAGFLKTDANGAVSVDTSTYLTSYTESDTLDSVTGRGATTTNAITVGGLTVDTDTLYVDATNDRVGIGTTSPATELEVKSQIGIRSSRPTSTQWVNLYYAGIESSATNDLYITSGVGYGTTFSTNGGDVKMRITPAGNVGIGTTSPSDRLHVEGTHATNTNYIYLSAGSSNSARFTKSDNIGTVGGALYLQAMNANNVLIATGGGNVGIGTTSPFGKLNITRAGINEGAISFDDQANNAHLVLAGSDALVRMQLGTYNNGSYGAWIQASYDNGGINYGTEPLILNPQGGNVGIGTTSPSQKLDVNGTANFGDKSINYAFVQVNGKAGWYTGLKLARGDGGYGSVGNNNYGLLVTDSGLEISTFSALGDNVTGRNARLQINNSGNVGIGTTAPEDKLHVLVTSTSAAQGIYLDSGSGNAGSAFLNVSTAEGPVLTGNTNTDGNVRGAYKASRIVFNGLGFKFQHSSETTGARTWSSHMVIDTDGKVGIGVGTPSTLLHVNGTITAPGITTTNTATVLDNTGIQPDQGTTEKTVVFKWSGTEIASLNNEGYFTASGYKTGGTTGYLKSDGTVDTSTFITSIPSEYVTDTELTTALNSYITVSSFNSATVFVLNGTDVGMGDDVTLGSAAFSASTDFVAVSGDTMTGDLQLGSNQLLFGTGNVAAPSTTNQHAGTRILLYPLTAGQHYAIGIESDTMWFNSDSSYKWYSDTSSKMTLDGSGNLTVAGTFTDGTGTLGGAAYKSVDYFATPTYVDTAISNLVDSAPTALNTLNELAAALGDDANFSTTVTTALGNRLRVDADQGLTTDQQSTGRSNLGLGTASTSNSGDFATSTHTHDWTQITSGTRTNYTLAFQPSTNNYAGFTFTKSNGDGGGYLLIRGTSDNDVYTAEGITLVADGGWLTLAQRTQTDKGIRFMTGSTSSTRMVIANGGNVGIGTTSADVKLHVNSAGTVNSQEIVLGLSSTSLRPMIQFSESAGVATGNGMSIEYDGRLSSGNNKMHINGVDNSPKLTVMSSGNVGVGTDSPYAKLQVDGVLHVGSYSAAVTPTNGMFIETPSGTDAQLLMYVYGSSVFSIKSDGANANIGWGSSANRTVNFVNTGTGDIKVGIGTTSPSYPLHVVGNSELSGSNHYYGTQNANNGTTTLTLRNYDTTLVDAGDIQGRIQFTGRYWSGSTSQLVESRIEHGHQESNGNGGSFLRFLTQTGGSGVAEQMRIDKAGNVGIGTTSPSAPLHVSGNKTILSDYGNTGHQIYTYQVSTGTSTSSNQVFDMYLGRFGNGYHKVTIWGSGYGTDVGNYFDITTSWGATSAPKIITNGGLTLGGGATYTLHYVRVDYASYDVFIKYSSSMPSGYSNTLTYIIESNTGSGYTQFSYPSGVTIPTLSSSNQIYSTATFNYYTGNVGIGTTSPLEKLDVRGSAYISGYTVGFDTNPQGNYAYRLTNDGGNSFLNLQGGNVGIGTTSPTQKLDVNGNIIADAYLGRGTTSTSDTGTGYASYDVVSSVTGPGLYQVTIVANPNSSGSGSYADYLYGKVIVGTGYSGSAVTHYIHYVQENPDPRSLYDSGGGNLTVEAFFNVNDVESSSIANGTTYGIRIKISGYTVAGSNTTVRTQKLG